ncbi:hypothetical protein GYMLUDRAFT_600536 [Collybiopsis luxurians FD-317 M1]|uniref:Transmembrane protein n=1 Tax=Collybiopsis luxurians FD-317 M1 TaxID=944289 RepID=A0A0D0BY85_9AGAR|nr:hypothetical protein GYMLUDRAFT_600536 [Collybiopsis luxurians FD-317 M1]
MFNNYRRFCYRRFVRAGVFALRQDFILSYLPFKRYTFCIYNSILLSNYHLAGRVLSFFPLLALAASTMTGTHLPVNQHANHHVHARYMSNIVVGPGGQVTLVVQSDSQSVLAVASSVTAAANPGTETQQVIFSSPSPLVVPSVSVKSPFNVGTSASGSPVAISTTATVVVTSEVFETPSSSGLPSQVVSGTSSSSVVSTSSLPSPSPSSTSYTTSPASSPLSTEVSSTRSSVLAASGTSTNSTSSSNTASTTTSATRESTFYVGIALGIIVVIACLAALIAWWFRLRAHNRRRKKSSSVNVPWAGADSAPSSPFPDYDSLEKGSGSIGGEAHQGLSSQDDARLRTWEPRGDRDVGEPKRTKSYLESINSSSSSPVKRSAGPILSLPELPPVVYPFRGYGQQHTLSHQQQQPPPSSYLASAYTTSTMISPSSLVPLQESVAYPLPTGSSLRPLPSCPPQSHSAYVRFNANMNANPSLLHSAPPSVHMQFLTDPEFGTPRMEMLKPRYLSLDDERGLSVPWKTEDVCATSASASVVDASISASSAPSPFLPVPIVSENMVASPVSLSERVLGVDCLQNPNSVPQVHAQNESWSSSLKANLVYAFNAVAKAAGGHGGGGSRMVDEEGEGKLTRLPVRSVSASRRRKSVTVTADPTASSQGEETEWVEYWGGELVGKIPEPATELAKVELEEIEGGRGVVHIHTSSSFVDGGRLSLLELGSEMETGLGLSFSSSSSMASGPSRNSSVDSYGSTAALVVRKKNPSVRSMGTMRSGGSRSGNRSGSGSGSGRRGRMSGSQRRPKYVYGYSGEMIMGSSSRSRSGEGGPKSGERPLSRMSTMRSMRSMKSVHSVMTVLTEREEFARKALIERRRGTGSTVGS